jgi:hypothetical protein
MINKLGVATFWQLLPLILFYKKTELAEKPIKSKQKIK